MSTPTVRIRKLRHWKQRFNKGAKFIWRRTVTWMGKDVTAGAPIPGSLANNGAKLRRFWDAGIIELAEFEAPDVTTGTVKDTAGQGIPSSANDSKRPQPLRNGEKWMVPAADPLDSPVTFDSYDEAEAAIEAAIVAKRVEAALQKARTASDDASNESAKDATAEGSEEPKAEEPKAEEPKAEEPKAEEPKAEEPKAEEPKAEEPKAEEPKAEKPEPVKDGNMWLAGPAADKKFRTKHEAQSAIDDWWAQQGK